MTYNLIGVGNNAKTIKGDGSEYLTAIMYLAPAELAFEELGMTGTLCPNANTAKCSEPCLNLAGRGQMNTVQAARLRKAMLYIEDRAEFMRLLAEDLTRFQRYCDKRGITPVVRPNGTTDIPWERIPLFVNGTHCKNIFEAFPGIQFYDYTKIPSRMSKELPRNYHLCLSFSNATDKYREQCVAARVKNPDINLVIVVRTKEMAEYLVTQRPDEYIDGDKDDLRFLDAPRKTVVLYAKGKAKTDYSGFVLDIETLDFVMRQ